MPAQRCTRFLYLFVFLSSLGAAQSLDPNRPAPLKPGLNVSRIDAFMTPHYWTMHAVKGNCKLVVTFRSESVIGAQVPTVVMFNLYNAKTPDKKIGNSINSNGTQVTHTFEGPIDQDAQMILEVVPPKAIVRLGGEYTVQAVAGMVFESGSTGAAVSVQDPILGRRFRTLYCNNTRDPACKLFSFEAGGSVVLPGGDRGTWRLFDAERGVYVIAAGGHRQSLKLKPGVGLVNVSDGESVVWEEVR